MAVMAVMAVVVVVTMIVDYGRFGGRRVGKR
jgi:hypothetical protein